MSSDNPLWWAATYLRHWIPDVSLMHGWLPPTIHLSAVVLALVVVGRRSRRWLLRHVTLAIVVGAALAACVYLYCQSTGLSGDQPPMAMWLWMASACTVLCAGVTSWRGARWWRRTAVLSASFACMLSAALVLNASVGYLPTVYSAWSQLTAGPLPHQTDVATAAAMQHNRAVPANGMVVPIETSSQISHFRHRGELAYLPPVWFSSTPPPPLPVVLMIGAEINIPTDWLRAGQAASAADAFAAAHGGLAPVLVFADSGGAFGVDTECVNGPRGNAADHLAMEVVPFMVSTFGVSSDRGNWGAAGFSTGGTCALDLAVMHPEMFGAFLDIAGDAGPNAGNKEETINRLFNGDVAAWAAFDPATVIAKHGPYEKLSGRFVIAPATSHEANAGGQDVAAHSLCDLGVSRGVDCTVTTLSGNHDWLFAAEAFRSALPWLTNALSKGAGRLRE